MAEISTRARITALDEMAALHDDRGAALLTTARP